MLSPTTFNKNFINKECKNTRELNTLVKRISQDIETISNLYFKIGKSKNNKIKYKKKYYSKTDVDTIKENIKKNINNIIRKNENIKKKVKKEQEEKTKKKILEELLITSKEKSFNGIESFHQVVLTEYIEDKDLIKDFLKKFIIENIEKKISKKKISNNYLKNKYLEKNNKNVFKENVFYIYEELFEFFSKVNLGNTFYYLFSSKEETDEKYMLDGSKKENVESILNTYSEQINNDPYLKDLNRKSLEKFCNPKIFLIILHRIHSISFSLLMILLAHYFRINNIIVSDKKHYIKKTPEIKFLEENLTRTFNKRKKIIEEKDTEKIEGDIIKKTDMLKIIKSYIVKKDQISNNKIDDEKMIKIKNYIFFIKKIIF